MDTWNQRSQDLPWEIGQLYVFFANIFLSVVSNLKYNRPASIFCFTDFQTYVKLQCNICRILPSPISTLFCTDFSFLWSFKPFKPTT